MNAARPPRLLPRIQEDRRVRHERRDLVRHLRQQHLRLRPQVHPRRQPGHALPLQSHPLSFEGRKGPAVKQEEPPQVLPRQEGLHRGISEGESSRF